VTAQKAHLSHETSQRAVTSLPRACGAMYCDHQRVSSLFVSPLASKELSSCWDGRLFGHNTLGPKSGGGCYAPFRGLHGFLSNTMWLWSRPASIPSGVLIRPTVWPQYTNVTDRYDRQTDNGPIAPSEPLYKRSPKNQAAVEQITPSQAECGEIGSHLATQATTVSQAESNCVPVHRWQRPPAVDGGQEPWCVHWRAFIHGRQCSSLCQDMFLPPVTDPSATPLCWPWHTVYVQWYCHVWIIAKVCLHAAHSLLGTLKMRDMNIRERQRV